MRCSQSINSNGGYFDIGVTGGDLSRYSDFDAPPQSAIGYARVVIPMGKAPDRLDCNALYALEIERLKKEIEMLKIGLE